MERERAVLEAQPELNHNPMLGDMYEGLARHLITRGVLKGLDIQVAGGKIRFKDKSLSGQLDAIVAYGAGELLPYTQHRIFDFTNVIAVVEVKKTLYGQALGDAFFQLKTACEPNPTWDRRRSVLLAHAWRGIVLRDYPAKGEELAPMDEMLKISLASDAIQPLRFVLGYSGYSSEFSLREGMFSFLKNQVSGGEKKSGFGVASMPDMIICGGASLIKLNGMPYSAPIADGFWPVIGSHSLNPFRSMLEFIWTRLAYIHELPSQIFGDDLETEVVNRFLDARWRKEGGWEYRSNTIDARNLENAPKSEKWAPTQITKTEFVVLNALKEGKTVHADDPKLLEWLASEGVSVERLTATLFEKRLAYRKGSEFRLLLDAPAMAFIPGTDGAFIGDDRTGRFSRWIEKYLEQLRASRGTSP